MARKTELTQLKNIIAQQRSEIAQLKNIIEDFPGDVYWKNKDGVWLGVNRRGSESLRQMGFVWKPSEIIGKTDYDLFN